VCEDRRYRAFGLLSFVHESVRIPVDYEASSFQICCRIARAEFYAWYGVDFSVETVGDMRDHPFLGFLQRLSAALAPGHTWFVDGGSWPGADSSISRGVHGSSL
jgi:hypothetical protein